MGVTMTLAEMETLLRWDRETGEVQMYTAAPHEARKWRRAGYAVEAWGVGWRAKGPKGCVRVRKVKDGALVKRVGRVPNDLRPKDVPF